MVCVLWDYGRRGFHKHAFQSLRKVGSVETGSRAMVCVFPQVVPGVQTVVGSPGSSSLADSRSFLSGRFAFFRRSDPGPTFAGGAAGVLVHSADGDPLHIAAPRRAGNHVEGSESDRFVVVLVEFSVGRNHDQPRPGRFAYFTQQVLVSSVKQALFAKDEERTGFMQQAEGLLNTRATNRFHRPVAHRRGHDIAVFAGTDHQNTGWCCRIRLPPGNPGLTSRPGRSQPRRCMMFDRAVIRTVKRGEGLSLSGQRRSADRKLT